jgi:competence protein ComEC
VNGIRVENHIFTPHFNIMPTNFKCSRVFFFYVTLLFALLVPVAGCASKESRRGLQRTLSQTESRIAGDTLLIRVYTGEELLTGERALEAREYQIHFIDAGQGDAILVLTPNATMLVDAGPADANVAEYLHSLDITGLDFVFATHPHADHIGGMATIIASFPVGEIIDPGVVHTTLTYGNYLKAIDEAEIPYTVGRSGMKRYLGENAFAEVIHPSDPDESSLNDASLVIRVVLGNVVLLFTGDIERKSEVELLASEYQLQSHILKVPHHGSSTSSHPDFLQAVNPETSIIMCGFMNSFGNPHRETLASLDGIGTMVWRTDRNGHIVVRTDGYDYLVEVTRDGPPEDFFIDINIAGPDELQKIIHIGPERAAQIIRLRPFDSVDDLIRVDGIGRARLNDIKRQNIARVQNEPEL